MHPQFLGQHDCGQHDHGGQVHHAHDDEQRHQRPAAAKAVRPVVGAGTHIPQPATIGAIVQQQRQRRATVLQAARLQRGELVHPQLANTATATTVAQAGWSFTSWATNAVRRNAGMPAPAQASRYPPVNPASRSAR